ncbi:MULTISPECIES: STAS domain-containing protein [unclassified Streptomyces]|uniref:STAS domain-containing protein n=1 Tax=unclassified Streptomyces TaxID=2593676 RepID=UPI0006AF79BB|nr:MULTISPECIES: STAS domain-containing protein [unclassified Streptomyces]KOX25474.1 anti-sigma factor antagonist [Streptomyces sp. NRRL F-6491]KOX42101.1 anti-sigma factor antagonist [Streptomyces sp. NRRL F-6492]
MPEREVNLDIEVEIRDADTAVVTVGGELDIETATLLHHHLANQFLHGRRHLVLDLSALDFMDSSGLNVLIRAGRDARESGGDLHLAAPTPAVRRILEITGLTMTTPLHTDVADALVAAGHEN